MRSYRRPPTGTPRILGGKCVGGLDKSLGLDLYHGRLWACKRIDLWIDEAEVLDCSQEPSNVMKHLIAAESFAGWPMAGAAARDDRGYEEKWNDDPTATRNRRRLRRTDTAPHAAAMNVAHLQLAFPIAEVESLEEPRPSRLPP